MRNVMIYVRHLLLQDEYNKAVTICLEGCHVKGIEYFDRETSSKEEMEW
jgi:hypothetical protein